MEFIGIIYIEMVINYVGGVGRIINEREKLERKKNCALHLAQ